jgi:hypothetical protein
VDSEAIFAIAAHSRNDARALEHLRGAMATGWIDAREPGVVFIARGMGRPLWAGIGRDGIFFASTKAALEIVERYCEIRLRKRQVPEGTLYVLKNGSIALEERFRPDLSYVEENPLPSVRAPQERDFCLTRLAALAAAA